jgi:peptidoglycan/xylan/chitin deacetylase (PgdA/CDA1 family)
VTFDDGYESFYKKAYPLLHELHVPAVNFVVTNDLVNPLTIAIPSLSKEEFQRMAAEDQNMDFQCHTDHLHQQVEGKAILTTKIDNG